MAQLRLTARRLNRTLGAERLDNQTARILARCDVARLSGGRIVRGAGSARTQITPSASTVLSSFNARTRSGDYINLYFNGSIIMTPGNLQFFQNGQGPGALNAPQNEWADRPKNDDIGIDGPLFSFASTHTYSWISGTGGAYVIADVAMFKIPIVGGASAYPATGIPADRNFLFCGIDCNAYYTEAGIVGYVKKGGGMTAGPQGVRLVAASTLVQHINGVGGAGVYAWAKFLVNTGDSVYSSVGSWTITALKKILVNDGATTAHLNPGDTFSSPPNNSHFLVKAE